MVELDRESPQQFRLDYRQPYDWGHVISFLASRATPGVEHVEAGRYRRTIAIGSHTGTIAVSPLEDEASLAVEVRFSDRTALPLIAERAARMFDVSADPAVIAKHLSRDPLLTHAVAAHPGIRVPGAWDPFELTVRAILGQQISVKGATTIAGRIASRWGEGLFPTPDRLADAPLEEAGLTSSRAATIRTLSREVRDGRVRFDGASTLTSLLAIPGIGDWTAQYVAMRALNEPDAFLSGDLILRRIAGNLSARELERRSEAWRPWRAYAVMLLWEASRK